MHTKKLFCLGLLLSLGLAFPSHAAAKKIVLVAGPPSHGPGEHEHNAGCLLLKKCLDGMPGIEAAIYTNGWPMDGHAFDGADAIVLYMDGGENHPALQDHHLEQLDSFMKKGVGLACLHYAVEPTLAKGQKEFLDWIGGAFEINWSVNPTWRADFNAMPNHPITRGVKPFALKDEWYFHMRFAEGLKGLTPILSAVVPASAMSRPDGAHEGNPAAREVVKAGEPQTVAWAFERPDGGRGFGFTGAHYHKNWGDENFRKIVLNAILWIAKADVPPNGCECAVSEADLKQNLDPKGRRRP